MRPVPYLDFIGAQMEHGPDGAALMRMGFSDTVLGRPGFLHGGAISGLLEMAAVAALTDALGLEPDAARIKPINVTIDFMRGGRERDTLAQASITRLGSRVANVEAIAWQDDRHRPIAAARMNYLIVREVSASR